MTWTKQINTQATWSERDQYQTGDVAFDADIPFDYYCPFDGFDTDPDAYWTGQVNQSQDWNKETQPSNNWTGVTSPTTTWT